MTLTIVQLITLSDLECDYLNARECCSKLNWVSVSGIGTLLFKSDPNHGHHVPYHSLDACINWGGPCFQSNESNTANLPECAMDHKAFRTFFGGRRSGAEVKGHSAPSCSVGSLHTPSYSVPYHCLGGLRNTWGALSEHSLFVTRKAPNRGRMTNVRECTKWLVHPLRNIHFATII